MRFVRVFAVAVVLAGVITATAAALAFTDDDFFWPNGVVGESYYKELHARGGCLPYKWKIISGALPDGLSLSSDGKVTGIPQRLGTFSFWIQLAGVGCANEFSEREFSIVVDRVRLRVDTPSAPDAVKGNAYSVKLAAVGGNGASYTWTVDSGKLPDGLSLSSDGTISGTPTTIGTFVFVAKVTDAEGKTDTHQFALKVVNPLAVKASPRVAEVGRTFSSTLQGSGGTPNYTFAIASGLPDGLTFDGTAHMTGTPTKSGAYQVAVSIKDADGLSTSINVSLNVLAKLTLVTKRLDSATVGATFAEKLKIRGGARPFHYEFAAGKAPKWLHVGARTGIVSGTPAAAGSFRFRIAVTDALGAVSTRSFKLAVNA